MKKVSLAVILSVICSLFAVGQQDTTGGNPPKKYKDRIVMDFYSSIWQGIPSDIKAKPIQFGFNASFIFDIPVKKNAPFSFGLGIGVTNFNLYSDGLWGIKSGYITDITPLPEGLDYRKNKITFTNLNIPLEFRYRHRSGFKIGAGVRIGTTADIHTKYFGRAVDGRDSKEMIKNYHIPNRTTIPVEATFRIGWKFVSIYGGYMVTKMFETDKGPQINPISVGISLCPY
ncbi:MAG: PorT family protein [Lentimicrobiaceae bacterium]|nr:PorT family protein [Lentimicrobiaceae bacterium]